MTTGTDGSSDDFPTATTAKWLTLLSLLPMLGVLLFGVAAVLGIRAFAHNNDCGMDLGVVGAQSCTHYSYTWPIVIGVLALVVAMGGAAFANYYAMRRVGLPLLASLRNRRTGTP